MIGPVGALIGSAAIFTGLYAGAMPKFLKAYDNATHAFIEGRGSHRGAGRRLNRKA